MKRILIIVFLFIVSIAFGQIPQQVINQMILASSMSGGVTPPAPWSYPTNGLIARWAFDTNYIESISGLSGTGYVRTAFDIPGFGDGSVNFDTVNYILTPNNFTNTALFSVSFWVNVGSVITNTTYRFTPIGMGQQSSVWMGYFIETWREKYAMSMVNSNQTGGGGTYSNAITDADIGIWRNIVFTFQGGIPNPAHFYKDGVELPVDTGHTNWTESFVQSLNLSVGRCAAPFVNNFFYGYVDEVVFYNRILSGSEALGIAQGVPIKYPARVYAYGADRTSDASYDYYTYTNPAFVGKFYLWTNKTCDILLVGGGGGGGNLGGGGGAGGVIYQASTDILANNMYNILVGKGGAGSSTINVNGTSGSNTTFGFSSTNTALGGGYGASYHNNIPPYNPTPGGNGGSGGGSAGGNTAGGPGGTGTAGQGYNGGASYNSNGTYFCHGGGGGGGSTGMAAVALQGGNGGTGYVSSISGSAVTYAAGGGGGGDSRAPGHSGGTGGSSEIGGHGGNGVTGQINGSNAVKCTGSGGGGGGYDGTNLGAGGQGADGVVIIRVPKTDTIPTNGLTSYWSFDGDANDDFGTNNATVVNAVLSNGVKGVANTAYYFDGSTAYLNIGNVGNLSFVSGGTDTAFSVSCWVKTASAASQTLLAKINDLNNSAEYTFSISGSPAFSTVVVLAKKPTAGLSDYLLNQSTALITSNAWNHVVITYNASMLNTGISLYINGVLSGYTTGNVGTYTGMGATTASARIGEWQYNGGYQLMKGFLDEMRVYGRVLTSNEVSIIYAIEKP